MITQIDLKALRKGNGMTQTQLGLVCGMNKSQISRMENGQLGSQETIERYLDALGYELKYTAVKRHEVPVSDNVRIIETLKSYVINNAGRYGILRIGIFGSYARGEQSPQSDIDICIQLEKPSLFKLSTIREDLICIFKKDVDLISLGSRMTDEFYEQLSKDVIYV